MLLKAMFNSPLGVAREMDRLFDSMLSSQPFAFAPSVRGHVGFPAVNVWEDESQVVAEAELPGLTMNDIEVLVTDDELTIRGSRTIETLDDSRPLRRERVVGEFERTITLPVAINSEGAEARLDHGILTITLPKSPAARPRRIDVKALPDT